MIRRPRRSTLFPYPPPFRSGRGLEAQLGGVLDGQHVPARHGRGGRPRPALDQAFEGHLVIGQEASEADFIWRSEEHTSELQSRQYLVCRLLLEKKNTRLNFS